LPHKILNISSGNSNSKYFLTQQMVHMSFIDSSTTSKQFKLTPSLVQGIKLSWYG